MEMIDATGAGAEAGDWANAGDVAGTRRADVVVENGAGSATGQCAASADLLGRFRQALEVDDDVQAKWDAWRAMAAGSSGLTDGSDGNEQHGGEVECAGGCGCVG